MRKLSVFFWVGLLMAGSLSAGVEHSTAGDTIPEVQLRKADGSAVDLHQAVASQPSIVVFYRGGWCPYCSKHLLELGRVEEELRDAGFQILAISPDRPEELRESQKQVSEALPDKENTYTLLADSEMIAAQAFGIAYQVDADVVRRYREDFDTDLEGASGHHLLPHPAVFIVTQDKTIRFAHVDPDYKTRLSGEEILSAAKKARTN